MIRPLILISNDDGITAPGIRTLISIMNEIGEVVVVAPDSAQSGMGHAITTDSTLYCDPVVVERGAIQREYSCSGTPADCIKIANNEILDRRPDLCVSGINHGGNASISVIYSGTMSAAIEAGIEGIPAIGFSLLDYNWNADFSHCREFVKNIALTAIKKGLPKGIVLNVNIPKLPKEKIKGIKICRQAKGKWTQEFDKRVNPQGREYFWMTGKFICQDDGEDTDYYALQNGYISIVPVHVDMTSHSAIKEIENIF